MGIAVRSLPCDEGQRIKRQLAEQLLLPATALRLRADVYLLADDHAAAMKVLEKAREISPRDESTLGRIAAALWLQRKPGQEALDKLVNRGARRLGAGRCATTSYG